MMRCRLPLRGPSILAALVLPGGLALCQRASAQAMVAPPGAPAPGVVAPAQPAEPTPGSTYLPLMSTGNPQSANGTIGGGNATESSAHPVTGVEEDTFDLGTHGGEAA